MKPLTALFCLVYFKQIQAQNCSIHFNKNQPDYKKGYTCLVDENVKCDDYRIGSDNATTCQFIKNMLNGKGNSFEMHLFFLIGPAKYKRLFEVIDQHKQDPNYNLCNMKVNHNDVRSKSKMDNFQKVVSKSKSTGYEITRKCKQNINRKKGGNKVCDLLTKINSKSDEAEVLIIKNIENTREITKLERQVSILQNSADIIYNIRNSG